jgi:hypothetical protein
MNFSFVSSPVPTAGAGPVGARRSGWFGLVERRERWGLSRRGRWLLILFMALAFLLATRSLGLFFALATRVPADVLVVDGWAPGYSLPQVVAEFQRGQYHRALVVHSLYDSPDKYESGRHMADYIANRLVELGVPTNSVQTVFCDVTRRDRTYHSALAAKHWLEAHGWSGGGVMVATLGAHARRSRLLYCRAFGPDVPIEVIALEDRAYDPAQWGSTSEGLKEITSETAAYLYARLFSRGTLPAQP